MEVKNHYVDHNRITDTEIHFFTPRFYAFDNLAAFQVDIWGIQFPTAEHAYQWKKFSVSHPDLAEEILHATSAYATKKISDAYAHEVPLEWHNYKVQVMEEIVRAKLAQHDKLRRLLVESGTKTIIESSPTDAFWGIADGTGQNMLGKIWMKLREELIESGDTAK